MQAMNKARQFLLVILKVFPIHLIGLVITSSQHLSKDTAEMAIQIGPGTEQGCRGCFPIYISLDKIMHESIMFSVHIPCLTYLLLFAKI